MASRPLTKNEAVATRSYAEVLKMLPNLSVEDNPRTPSNFANLTRSSKHITKQDSNVELPPRTSFLSRLPHQSVSHNKRTVDVPSSKCRDVILERLPQLSFTCPDSICSSSSDLVVSSHHVFPRLWSKIHLSSARDTDGQASLKTPSQDNLHKALAFANDVRRVNKAETMSLKDFLDELSM
jgi:hypothetical protein